MEESTKNIASLRKKLVSLEGDNSEETKAKVQQLRLELADAEQELEETEFDRLIENTQKITDDLFDQYSEILNMRLDNVDALLSDMIVEINTDASTISSTLSEKADQVGYTLSESMTTIWDTNSTKINGVITAYGDKFTSAQTTTNNALNNINNAVQSMLSHLDKKAAANVKNASNSSAANPPKSNTPNATKPQPNKGSSGGDGKLKVGDRVTFDYGQYYYSSDGFNPVGSKHLGQQVYITKIEDASWATHPIHISTGNKLGSGDLGWLKKEQISGYATGKKNFLNDEVAWTQENGREFIVRPSDGAILTPIARKGSVLNAQASNNLWNMTNSPAEFIKDNLNLGATNIPNNSNVQSNYTQHIDNVVFRMDNVKNYEEMLSTMQKDKNFERLVLSMSIDRIAGKSSLAKGKSIR